MGTIACILLQCLRKVFIRLPRPGGKFVIFWRSLISSLSNSTYQTTVLNEVFGAWPYLLLSYRSKLCWNHIPEASWQFFNWRSIPWRFNPDHSPQSSGSRLQNTFDSIAKAQPLSLPPMPPLLSWSIPKRLILSQAVAAASHKNMV